MSYILAIDQGTHSTRAAVFDAGGRMLDSSPMYGSSQPVIGYALDKLGRSRQVFSADKVWIRATDEGRQQMEASRRYWGVPGFDLMQVHNLVSWQEHLETLYEMKEAGDIRYVGITTSHGRRHEEFEEVIKTRELDFVQFSYNLLDREAEQRLLPLAAERRIGVIVNRPFQRGDLIDRLEDDETAQFLLRRLPRDMASLCGWLDRLAVASLEAQRRLTVPFVREVMRRPDQDS